MCCFQNNVESLSLTNFPPFQLSFCFFPYILLHKELGKFRPRLGCSVLLSNSHRSLPQIYIMLGLNLHLESFHAQTSVFGSNFRPKFSLNVLIKKSIQSTANLFVCLTTIPIYYVLIPKLSASVHFSTSKNISVRTELSLERIRIVHLKVIIEKVVSFYEDSLYETIRYFFS